MRNWVISVPVWGERCILAFLEVALPAIEKALDGRLAKFIVHTDCPDILSNALLKYDHQILRVPMEGEGVHKRAGAANREALSMAPVDSYVAFINADMVPSIEVFEAAERRFEAGKRVIMMAASRTIGAIPPIGARSRDLLAWTMQHPHPTIVECFWGTGRSTIPWAIYFKRGEDIVLHGFHLHPFALVKSDPKVTFRGTSIDTDLMDQFQLEEVHLVTDADEAAFAEMSPKERLFRLMGDPFTESNVAHWAHGRTTPLQRWTFMQPITIVGKGNAGEQEICEMIIEMHNAIRPSIPPRWKRLLQASLNRSTS